MSKSLLFFYGYGAVIHLADLPSLGQYLGQSHSLTFSQMPVAWKIATAYFALLDTLACPSLWKGTAWGIVCFLLAAVSQVVMYTAFTTIFSHQPGLVVFHVVTVGVYVLLRVWGEGN